MRAPCAVRRRAAAYGDAPRPRTTIRPASSMHCARGRPGQVRHGMRRRVPGDDAAAAATGTRKLKFPQIADSWHDSAPRGGDSERFAVSCDERFLRNLAKALGIVDVGVTICGIPRPRTVRVTMASHERRNYPDRWIRGTIPRHDMPISPISMIRVTPWRPRDAKTPVPSRQACPRGPHATAAHRRTALLTEPQTPPTSPQSFHPIFSLKRLILPMIRFTAARHRNRQRTECGREARPSPARHRAATRHADGRAAIFSLRRLILPTIRFAAATNAPPRGHPACGRPRGLHELPYSALRVRLAAGERIIRPSATGPGQSMENRRVG